MTATHAMQASAPAPLLLAFIESKPSERRNVLAGCVFFFVLFFFYSVDFSAHERNEPRHTGSFCGPIRPQRGEIRLFGIDSLFPAFGIDKTFNDSPSIGRPLL